MRFFRAALVVAFFAAILPLAAQKSKPSEEKPVRNPGLYMTFETSMGNITCKLYEKEAPLTVHNIVGLAVGKIVPGKHFYDGLIFHRVIPQFMIQGGDPTGTGMGGPKGPGFPFKDEFSPSLKFDVPGRLAMANSGPGTNGSQFFITEVPTPHLNNHHTIFGQCENMDAVKAITRVPRDANDKPQTPVVIKHVKVERVGAAPPNAPEAHKPGGATHGEPAMKPQ